MEPRQAPTLKEAQTAAAMALEPDAVSSKPGLIKNLLDRRILQLAGIYLGTVWTVSRFVNWLVDRFVLSPYLEDLFMLAALLVAPLIFVLAYGHGAKGKNRWSRTEKIFIPCNVILAIVVLFLIFGGKDLGSAQKTVLVVDAEGNEIERVIPKSEFRKRLALFYFDNTSGNEDLDWLRQGLPEALDADLEQDPFFIATTAMAFSDRLRTANFADGFGVPLALQRQIAEEYNYGYVLTGSVDQQDNRYRIETKLHRVQNGKVVAEHTVEGTDLMALADEIAVQLKEDLEIPKQHIEETIDLPLAEVMTASLPAFRAYVLAGHARAFDQDFAGAITLINEAVAQDPTFAQAYLNQFQGLLQQNRRQEAMQALAAAQQHNYRLTEQDRFRLTFLQFFFNKQPAEALQAVQQWSTLYPDDTDAFSLLAEVRTLRGETEEAIAALRRINGLDPQAARQLQIGDLLRGDGRYEEALEEYQTYAERFPKKKAGYERIGLTYRAMGELEQEQAAHRQALIVASDDPTILANLGETHLRLGDFDEALEQYRTAVEQSRTPRERLTTQEKLMDYHWLRGDYDQALVAFEAYFEILRAIAPPSNVLLLQALRARRYAQAGHLKEALAFVDRAKAHPTYLTDELFALNADLAQSLVRLEQGPENTGADEVLERAETIVEAYGLEDPNRTFIQGLINQKLERYAEAAEAYQRFVEQTPGQEGGWIALGEVQYEMGQRDEARKNLEHGLKLFPSHPEVHLGLAKIANDQQRYDDARQHLDQALAAWADASPNHEDAQEARQLRETLAGEP